MIRRLASMLVRLLRAYLIAAGAVATLVVLWLLLPLPLFIEEPLIVNERPVRSDAIVCLSAGSVQGMPSSSGWRRVATAVRLHKDGFAPVVIFSGGIGSSGRSEAEIYASSAVALGLPGEAARLEKLSESTEEHPAHVADMPEVQEKGGKDAALLLVTSPYHGRRARSVFRKAGFTHFRIITTYGVRSGVGVRRSQPKALEVGQFGIDRLYRTIVSVREWAALGYYKLKGWI